MSPAHLTLSDEGIVGVMVVENNTTRFTPVTILSNDTNGVWVAGLPAKVDVITVGQEYVKDGQTVVAVPEGSQFEGSNKRAQLEKRGQS